MFLRITFLSRRHLAIFILFFVELLLISGVTSTTTTTTTSKPSTLNRPARALPTKQSLPSPGFSSKVTRCPSSAEERHKNGIIRIGVILPFKKTFEWSVIKVKPAIEYARDYILKETDLLQNYTIDFEYRDSNCSETKGPLEAIDLYTTRSADAFLGPACNYAIAPIARFSSAWGIPVLSAGAMVKSFDDKEQYELLTRLMGGYNKAGEFFLSVLKSFKYKKIGMMLHNNQDVKLGKSKCWFAIEALFVVLKSRLNTDLDLKNVEFFDENRPVNYEKNLQTLSQKCRGMSE